MLLYVHYTNGTDSSSCGIITYAPCKTFEHAVGVSSSTSKVVLLYDANHHTATSSLVTPARADEVCGEAATIDGVPVYPTVVLSSSLTMLISFSSIYYQGELSNLMFALDSASSRHNLISQWVYGNDGYVRFRYGV
jgi:hypothetical protein